MVRSALLDKLDEFTGKGNSKKSNDPPSPEWDNIPPLDDSGPQPRRGFAGGELADPSATVGGRSGKLKEKTSPPRNKEPLREYKAVDIRELLAYQFPRREFILAPIFTLGSVNMVFAWRGIGKTHFAIGVAYAAASGGDFLKWTAPRPFRVLYLDGEMPGETLQERLAAIGMSSDKEPAEGFFKVITIDMNGGLMPDLATVEGQAQIADECDQADIIIVDNLSCLVRGNGKENDSQTWLEVGEWALSMRSKGKCVIFIHHAGKNGEQRGTSKKEDQLDVSISLKRPSDYEADQGARFELRFDKARHLTGGDAEPFECWLVTDENGHQVWSYKAVKETTYDQVVDLSNLGMSQTEIANELNINKSNVCRAYKKAVDEGLIRKEPRSMKQSKTDKQRSDIHG